MRACPLLLAKASSAAAGKISLTSLSNHEVCFYRCLRSANPRDQAGCYQGSHGKRAWPRLANLQTQESLPQTSTHCLTTCKVTKIRGWLAQWSSGWSPPSRSGVRNLTAYVSVSDCPCLIPVSINILLANTPIRCQSRSPGGGLIDFNPNQL